MQQSLACLQAAFCSERLGSGSSASRDAKKVYTHATAAVLRAKEDVMTTVTTLRENCGDILADAKAINEERAAAACEEIADTAEEPAAEPAEA